MSGLFDFPRLRRAGRLLLRTLTWLANRMIRPPVLIPLAVLLATWAGFQQNAGLYLRSTLASAWYDATLIAVLILPAAIGQVTAWLLGYRSAFWWALWVPGVALYWLRPWHIGTEWAFFWREHLDLWTHFVNILRMQEQAPLQSFVRLGGILIMALVTFMVVARSWFRAMAGLQKIGRDTGEGNGTAGGGKAEGLPQAIWASASEVRDTFSHKGGIVLGEHTDPLEDTKGFDPDRPRSWKGQGKGRLITMDPTLGNGHVVVLAASAGYKTAGIVIPNILHYDNPLVVIDPKGDLHARTWEARKAKGFTARVIDARHGFDPFKMIAPLAPEAPSVYLTMARTLMPLADRASDISEYFHEMSTTLFAALMGHFIAENSDNVAGDISAFINRKRAVVIEEAQHIALRHKFPFIGDELEGLAALDERTFPGVVKGISNKLAFTRFPDVAAYGQSSESPEDHLAALDPKSDIFINFPTLAAGDFSSFPRLLIGAMYVASELIEQPDRPRARRLFLIDEARVLGGMDALNNIRDAGRSIGLHLMLIYQNYGQLTKAWGGEAGAAAWLDSCEARVISAVGSSRTANDIVTMLGRRTLRARVQGSSASNPVMTPMGGTVSSSEQEQIREVPLMSAATLGQLPAHGSLIFTRRSRPILATKAIFFTRDKMAPLVKSPDAVAGELEATRRRDAVKKKMEERAVQNLPDPQPGLRPRSWGQDKNAEDGDEVSKTTTEANGNVAGNPAGGEPPSEAGSNAASPPDAMNRAQSSTAQAPDTTVHASNGADADRVHTQRDNSRSIPACSSKMQARIAAALAEKARRKKAAGAGEHVAEEQDADRKTDTAPVSGSDAEIEPDTTPDTQPGELAPSGEEPQPEQGSGTDETDVAAPDPDGLCKEDRAMMTTIMAALAKRPQLHSAVARALVTEPDGHGSHAGETMRGAEAPPDPEGPTPERDAPGQADANSADLGKTEVQVVAGKGTDQPVGQGDTGASREDEANPQEHGNPSETQGSDDHADNDGDAPEPDRATPEAKTGEDPVEENRTKSQERDTPPERQETGNPEGGGRDQPDTRDIPPAQGEKNGAGNTTATTGEQKDGRPDAAGAAEQGDTGVSKEDEANPQEHGTPSETQGSDDHADNDGDAPEPDRAKPEAKTDKDPAEENRTKSQKRDNSPESQGTDRREDGGSDEPEPPDLEIEAALEVLKPPRKTRKKTGKRGGTPAQADAGRIEEPETPRPDRKDPTESAEKPETGMTASSGMENGAAPSEEAAVPDSSNQPVSPGPSDTGKTAGSNTGTTRHARPKPARKPDAEAKRRRALDANEVREAFDPHIEDFFRAFYGEPARPGADDWRPRERDSFSMVMAGPKRGCWYDHAADDGGSLFDLVAKHICDLPDAQADFPRVLEAAADFAGFSPANETPRTRTVRKQRKEKRDRAAEAEEHRKTNEAAILVLALRGLAQPVVGSPAETYLTSRTITTLPETGLGYLPSLDNALPDPLRPHVYSPEHPALVVWARDDGGTITGGQRILLDDTGRPMPTKPRKPSFGTLKGSPARFSPVQSRSEPTPRQAHAEHAAERAARMDNDNPTDAPGPLLVTEGPETALTLWQATGYETWAVFGVSGWRTAPLPTDRDIILAPDRDAPSSKAGKAFRKAVAHHLERGCTLHIAPAPEPEGSRKDLNDTAMEQGIDAVLAALETAHPPGPDDLPDDEAETTHSDPPATPGNSTEQREPSSAKAKPTEPTNEEREDDDERSTDRSGSA